MRKLIIVITLFIFFITLSSCNDKVSTSSNKEQKLDLNEEEIIDLLNQVDRTNLTNNLYLNLSANIETTASENSFTLLNGVSISIAADLNFNLSSYENFYLFGNTTINVSYNSANNNIKFNAQAMSYINNENAYINLELKSGDNSLKTKRKYENIISEDMYLIVQKNLNDTLSLSFDSSHLTSIESFSLYKDANDHILRFSLLENSIFESLTLLGNDISIDVFQPLTINCEVKFNNEIKSIGYRMQFIGTIYIIGEGYIDATVDLTINLKTGVKKPTLPSDNDLKEYQTNDIILPFILP